MNNKFNIVEVNSSAEMSAAVRIRDLIFVEEQGIPVELEHDGFDAASIHVIAGHHDAIVATARLTITADEPAILARVAVLPEYRGQGIGRLLVRKLEEIAREKNVREIVLHPHHYLEKFYHDLGYCRVDGEQVVGRNPLITMQKQLCRVD